jgi:lipoprotein NlpD
MMRWRVALPAATLLALAACSTPPPAPVVDRTPARRGPSVVAPQAPRTAAPVAAAEGVYIVKRGDTLYSIALEHGVDYRELAQWNGIDDPARISSGQELRVKAPEERGVQVSKAQVESRIEARPLDAPVPAAREEPKLVEKPAAQAGEFIWPLKGKVIAGFAEPRSKGIDIDGKVGDPVVAAAAGRVTYTGSGIPGLGKLVVIKHENGFITVYAHNRDILVKEQQNVARGQKIAELGASDAERPKLHFQIRKGAAAVDPLRYLPAL